MSGGPRMLIRRVMDLAFARAGFVVANLALIAVASHLLSKQDYAALRQVFLPYDIAGPIVALGIPSAVHYYLPRYRSRASAVFDLTLITAIPHILFSLALWQFGSETLINLTANPALSAVVALLPIYVTSQGLSQTFTSILSCDGKTRVIAIGSCASIAILVAGAVLPLMGINSLEVFALARVASVGCLALLLGLAVHAQSRPFQGVVSGVCQRTRTMLSVSVPLGIASALGALSLAMDKAVVASLGQPEDYATYINGAMELPIIGVVSGSFASVVMGGMARSVAAGDLGAAARMFRDTATEGAKVLVPIMVFSMMFSADIMTTLFSSRYADSAIPFTLYLLLIPLRIVVFGTALVALGQSRVVLRRAAIELGLNLALSVGLWYALGYNGVAAATVVVAYAWSAPYSVKVICRGFRVRWRELFDLRRLRDVMLVSSAPVPAYVVIKCVCDGGLISIVAGLVPLTAALWFLKTSPTYRSSLFQSRPEDHGL